MATIWNGWYWHLGLASFVAMGGAIAALSDCAHAQVAPDGTLGAESSVVTPTNANGLPGNQIDGGAARGANLFHSFDEFSVPTGSTAFFNNALDIQNIISRVTGSSISNIDGLLRANGTANLFLINPNGIVFGPNASLNIGGSFVGSTASSLNFADGTQFSATAPQATPLLTVSVPIGLQYGGTAGSILNQSQVTNSSDQVVGLAVQPGETLALLGGNVSLDGGRLQAPGGRVELGGVAGAGTVGVNVNGNNLGLSFPNDLARADVSIANRSGVSVTAGGSGSIAINAQNLNVLGGSFLYAGIRSSLGSVDSQPGDITLNATEAIGVSGSSAIDNSVLPGAVGNSGNINVTTGSLSLTDGAFLNASTLGQGNAGSVNINARDTVSFDGVSSDGSSSAVFSNVESGAVGNGGDINVTTGSLSLTDGAFLNASTLGQGNAGSVNINARDTVSFDGVSSDGSSSAVFSNVESGAVGNGGDINVTAGSLLFVTNGAQLQTVVREADIPNQIFAGRGNAGNINIEVRDDVTFAGLNSAAFSSVGSGAEGRGGNITLTARSLSLREGAGLNTVTFGQAGETGRADAGNIRVNVSDSVSVSGGSQLRADTFGEGNAGNVNIEAANATVSFDGVEIINGVPIPSGIFSAVQQVPPEFIGARQGGDITIKAGSLSLTDGAQLEASTYGQGDAGNVRVDVQDTVTLARVNIVTLAGVNYAFNSAVLSQVGIGSVGDGGNINIEAGALSMNDFSVISSSTNGLGNAGGVSVQANGSVSLTNSSNIRSVIEPGGIGNGGDIDIQARSLSLTNGSQVLASVFREVGSFRGGQGEGGNILVSATESVNLSGVSSVQLPVTNPLNPSEVLPTEGFSSGLIANTERGAIGPAGSITVKTGTFRIADGAVVDVLTANSGAAGDITINANTFEATGGGQVLTTTRSSGSAGNITLNITDSITLSSSDPTFDDRFSRFGADIVNNQGPESGLFANTAPSSTGEGGSIFIPDSMNSAIPMELTITDGARVSVDSQGQGNAGELQIQAGAINLDRGAFLSATTASGEGGNITLRAQDLLRMRRNSNISTAARGTGNGGNIDIDADLIVAFPSEDSNIIADAIEGQGGNINITTQGLFGIQSREQQTLESDITASSELGIDGVVEINNPDVDPYQGLVELPAELVDASNQIVQGCPDAVWRGESKFIITGRGGLPPSPHEPLRGDNTLTNWSTLEEPEVENRSDATPSTNSTIESAPTQIVEANGWVKGPNGEVTLVATAPTATLDIPWLPESSCNAPEPES